MLNPFDPIFILCIALIFKFSGNLDIGLSIIFSIFFYYVIKTLVYKKYGKDVDPIYEIKGLLNIDTGVNEEDNTNVISETFVNYSQKDNEDLYKM